MKNLSFKIFLLFLLASCQQKKTVEVTPWGDTLNVDGAETEEGRGTSDDDQMSLKDIIKGGEMIMLTISGPDTYYDYHGKALGVQYLLCEKLAEHLGVALRVDVCKDTLDMLNRIRNGEGDVAAVPVSKSQRDGFLTVADGWVVNGENKELANAIRIWYKPKMLAEQKTMEKHLLSNGFVRRHVYAMMQSPEKGQISIYDNLFKKYAPSAGMDWSLMAAQCYQESCFDPYAASWAGAGGLMQIMPRTCDHLGLPRNMVQQPEPNISAAARLMRELQGMFKEIGNPEERIKFALAAYNAGPYHIMDAQALARKYGGSPLRWDDVRHYVLALMQPKYYHDPVVKYGYMRGTETSAYVDKIMARWQQYRDALRTGKQIVSTVHVSHKDVAPVPASPSILDAVPHRASKKNKWR